MMDAPPREMATKYLFLDLLQAMSLLQQEIIEPAAGFSMAVGQVIP